jgi:hypothetical protein
MNSVGEISRKFYSRAIAEMALTPSRRQIANMKSCIRLIGGVQADSFAAAPVTGDSTQMFAASEQNVIAFGTAAGPAARGSGLLVGEPPEGRLVG